MAQIVKHNTLKYRYVLVAFFWYDPRPMNQAELAESLHE